mmetsp:Transcript_64102/g.187566  ORF Transcript_64102/g.187566 Transcript_64102/m.187566 type:complete len:299 (-) Transcript_64102:408-1304(-)
MTTFFAIWRAAATASTSVVLHSPVMLQKAAALAGSCFFCRPSTSARLLFMATHIMPDRIAPLEPMSAPTMVSRLFASTKPSAVSAQPEALLSSVMTTGMSAPPTPPVTSQPRAPARPVPRSSTRAPSAGRPTKAARPRQRDVTSRKFRKFCPAKEIGLPDIRPWSFAKASRLPVTVRAPITAARYVATLCKMSMWKPPPKKDASAVDEAAKPTRLWKAATSWGRSVTSTRFAMPTPTLPPRNIVPSICASTGPVGAMETTVPQSPPATPMRPRALPDGAVFCEERAPMERMQSNEETK